MEEALSERSTHPMDRELLINSLQNEDIEKFRDEFLELHPYDQASFFKELDEDTRERIYHYLSPEEMATLFENLEIDDESYQDVLGEMNPNYAA